MRAGRCLATAPVLLCIYEDVAQKRVYMPQYYIPCASMLLLIRATLIHEATEGIMYSRYMRGISLGIKQEHDTLLLYSTSIPREDMFRTSPCSCVCLLNRTRTADFS
jgi:hypothetical protein